jgi:hypothetical protein
LVVSIQTAFFKRDFKKGKSLSKIKDRVIKDLHQERLKQKE